MQILLYFLLLNLIFDNRPYLHLDARVSRHRQLKSLLVFTTIITVLCYLYLITKGYFLSPGFLIHFRPPPIGHQHVSLFVTAIIVQRDQTVVLLDLNKRLFYIIQTGKPIFLVFLFHEYRRVCQKLVLVHDCPHSFHVTPFNKGTIIYLRHRSITTILLLIQQISRILLHNIRYPLNLLYHLMQLLYSLFSRVQLFILLHRYRLKNVISPFPAFRQLLNQICEQLFCLKMVIC